ncbi:MAG: CPBP family intramembrane metalloprotease [Oscillospiraceae bacterium]|nr:CPBP family intramembrane metalloprotease [Oscillospiraceae bacterium]
MKNEKNKETLIKELLPAAIIGVSSLFVSYIPAILYLFIEKFVRKLPFSEIGFGIKGLFKSIQKYWWLILAPIATALSSVYLSKLVVPEFFDHVIERTEPMLVSYKLYVLIPLILLLAFAEEIGFRAFLQRKFNFCINPIAAILITSLLFAVGHFSKASPIVVIYDLTWIFIDSIIFGTVFYKTKSVYLSWISHSLGNLTGVVLMLVIF